MVMPIIPRGDITDLPMFMQFSAAVPAMSPPTPDRMDPDVYLRRDFYGGLPVQMPDATVLKFWGFFDPMTGLQKFPSEAIRVTEGQLVHVELTPGRNTHTIHHHGIEPTPYNDGVGHLSFEVAGSYTYQWRAAQSGTFFYHCHKNTVLHFELGMYGALIVDPPNGPGWVQRGNEQIPYDVEAVWVPDDIDPAWNGLGHDAGIGFPFGIDAGLNSFDPQYHMVSGVPAPNTETDPRVAVNCSVGQTVLIRLINAAYALVRTTIDGLDAEVIEIDGRPLGQAPHSTYSQPFTIPAGETFKLATAQRYGMLFKPTRPGTHRVTFEFENSWAQRGKRTVVETFINVSGTSQVAFSNTGGTGAVTTAAAVSKAAYPTTARSAVIVNGSSWPHVLSAAALAGAVDGPILWTNATTLPSATATELRRLKPRNAYIIGGASSVSGTVRSKISALTSTKSVRRITGSNRYDTAAKVADQVKAARLAAGKPFDGTALFVSGSVYGDAMAASTLAAAMGWPILLVNAAGLPAETLAAINRLGITRAIAIGGPAVITPAVTDALKARFDEYHVAHVGGVDRYETNAVANQLAEGYGLGWSHAAVVGASGFNDGFATSVLQAKRGSMLVMTPSTSLHPATQTALINSRPFIQSLRFVGSSGALTETTRATIRTVLA